MKKELRKIRRTAGRYKPHLKYWLTDKLGRIRWKYLDLCPVWRCNARCPTCGSWKRDPKIEIGYFQSLGIVHAPQFKFLEYVIVEGGEPMLWRHLGTFVKLIMLYHKNCIVAIITNGLAVDEVAHYAEAWKVFRKRLRWLVSLNGIDKVHDASRGAKGAYEKTVASARILKKVGHSVTFSFAPFVPNIGELWKVRKLGLQMDIPINICFPNFSGKFGDNLKWEFLSYSELRKLMEERMTEGGIWDRMALRCLYDSVRDKKLIPCWGGRQMIHINPKGIIRPCSMDETMQLGRVTERGVEDLDFSDLERIPHECQYTPEGVCSDCYMLWTMRRNVPELIKWRIGL